MIPIGPRNAFNPVPTFPIIPNIPDLAAKPLPAIPNPPRAAFTALL